MRASSDLNGFPRRIEVLDRQAPCPEYHCLLAEVFEGARCWNVASQVLNIQELLDYTLDYLSNSPTDLISCALVAKAWVSPAQRHIYRHLDLTPDDSAYHEVKFHQVCHTLENNPHLIPLVRRVSVPLNSCALTDVARVLFTHLADFRLECTSCPWAARAQLITVSPLQKLLRLPRLRRVMLWGYLEPVSIIDEYFYLCSPNIRQLLLALDNLDEYPGLYPECAILEHPQFTSKPKIALMHLSVPRELEGWMRGPRCPFGFAQLRSLEIRGSDWPALQEIFAPCLPQLELLWLTPLSPDTDIDLALLPSLKSLNVQIIDDPDGLCAVIALLAGLPTKNNLQTLAITFPADSAIPQERAFRDFDARVAALKTISSLKSIEITLPLEMDSTESIIRSYLTRLASKAPLSTFLE